MKTLFILISKTSLYITISISKVLTGANISFVIDRSIPEDLVQSHCLRFSEHKCVLTATSLQTLCKEIMHFFLYLLSANDQVDFWDGDNLTGNRTSVTNGSTVTEFSPVSLNISGDSKQYIFFLVCVFLLVCPCACVCVCVCVCMCVCVSVSLYMCLCVWLD